MALILNIDTATENASVSLCLDGISIAFMENKEQREHAGWVHMAISKLSEQANIPLEKLQATAVSSGPGSYTGLRIGMATAKGLCYALDIPLITENTLRLMAAGMSEHNKDFNPGNNLPVLFCPMLDARRSEVFTAIFDKDLLEILPPGALVPDGTVFAYYLQNNNVLFSGSGSKKWKVLCDHPRAHFKEGIYDSSEGIYNSDDLGKLAEQKFQQNNFTDLAYAEPLYLKEFFTYKKNEL